MKPTTEEIANSLARLTERISAYGDDPISDAERQSLSKATAYCVEMVRRKYGLVSAYYTTAEIAATRLYGERYESGLKFH